MTQNRIDIFKGIYNEIRNRKPKEIITSDGIQLVGLVMDNLLEAMAELNEILEEKKLIEDKIFTTIQQFIDTSTEPK